jgi:hypothetical protein
MAKLSFGWNFPRPKQWQKKARAQSSSKHCAHRDGDAGDGSASMA